MTDSEVIGRIESGVNEPEDNEHSLYCPAGADPTEVCLCPDIDRENAEAAYEMRRDR